jgi:transcriptional regulator with XRE-family HTH domain
MPSDNTKLKNLGTRLHDERLKRNETQTIFAARIGISVPTLRKMESGSPAVLIGYWVTALELLDRDRDLDALLAAPEDLFAKYELQNLSARKRASRGSQ